MTCLNCFFIDIKKCYQRNLMLNTDCTMQQMGWSLCISYDLPVPQYPWHLWILQEALPKLIVKFCQSYFSEGYCSGSKGYCLNTPLNQQLPES